MREAQRGLEWQSKLILLIVVPCTAIRVLLQSYWWLQHTPVVAWTTLGISGVFGLVVWRMRAGTLAAAATGAAITASLMYSTTRFPYATSWLHGGLLPLLAVFLLTFAATKIGKAKKEQIGTGEGKRGRNAAQVAANLGVAALMSQLVDAQPFFGNAYHSPSFSLTLASIALAEAAADTVSSEIGQVFGGQPRMLTTMRKVDAGTDGGVTLSGTFAGILAASVVVIVAAAADGRNLSFISMVFIGIALAGAVFGLFIDSLFGALLERRGWLNNDSVNFLSTLSAPIAVLAAIAVATYWIFR